MLYLRVLGRIELNGSDGQSIGSVLAQPKRLALLSYLALSPGFSRKDLLLPLFWPEADQEHARAALRQQVYLLRRSLGAGVVLGRGDDEIGIPPDMLRCDAVEFREMLARGDLEGALDRSSGELLPGFFLDDAPEFERWLDAERTRLRDEAAEAARALAERAAAAEDVAQALHWTKRQLALAPMDEIAQRRLLLLLVQSGDRAGAMAAYEEFASHLEQRYQLEPSAETRALAERIRTGEGMNAGAPTDLTGAVPTSAAVGGAPPASPSPERAGESHHDSALPLAARASVRRGGIQPSRIAQRRVGLLAALVLAIGVGITAYAPPRRPPVLAVGEIRDFTGGDPSLAPAVEAMLTAQLAQRSGMRVLSDSRVEQFLEPGQRVGRRLAIAARRAGATDLVNVNLYRATSGRLRFDMQRVDLASGTVRALPPVEGTDASVLTRLAVLHLAAAPGDPPGHAASASVAVLPFLDVSADQKAEYLADGISIDLMNSLGRIPGLWVASRRASFSYKGVTSGVREVGRDLGVRYLFEGSVSKEDDRLRINVQLVDVADGRLRWSQSFVGKKSEIFALQDQIEHSAVQTLRGELKLPDPGEAPPRPRDPAAYDAYLRGRFLLRDRTQPRIRKAIEYFTRAAGRDPGYALAYAGLADAYVSLAAFECPDSVLPRARAAIDRALSLDDGLAEMHLARANILLHFDWQWEAAEREHRRALQLEPGLSEAHFGYASFLRAARRPDEALREVRQAMALKQAASPDTLAFAVVKHRKLSEFLYYAGRYAEARAQARASLDLDPGSVQTRLLLALIDVQDGEVQRAAEEADAMLAQVGDHPSQLADLGYIFARAGRTDDARAMLDSLRALSRTRYVPRDEMAIVHLGLGETDLALDRFESAIADRHWWLVYLNADPRLDPLRAHPRFQRLMRRINAPL